MRLILAAALLSSALLLSACRSTSRATTDTLTTLAGVWVLEWMQGVGPVSGRAPSMEVAPDGSVTGFGGVNRFSTSLQTGEIRNNIFNVSPVIATRMGGPPEAMDQETRFFEALGRAERFRLDEGRTLVIAGASGELLRFLRRGK